MDGASYILPDGIHAAYAPGAACGDSQGFARALVDRLRAGGATVLEGQPVTRLLLRDGRVIGAESAAGRLHADAVILAAGVGTRKLARTAAVRAPILPVKGYAATVPVTDVGGAPRVAGVLENRHVAFSRMGDRLRLSTGAEIGRTDHDVTEPMMRLLKQAGEDLCPGALDWPSARYRAEHRPMTPSGLPMIGPTRTPGLDPSTRHTARWAGPRQLAQPTY